MDFNYSKINNQFNTKTSSNLTWLQKKRKKKKLAQWNTQAEKKKKIRLVHIDWKKIEFSPYSFKN